MNDNEYYDFEGRRYVSPTLSRDEQMQFADALRGTMNRNTAQINTQTKNLGTDVPSNLGGLTGSNSYFSQRYQTMPVESQVNTLKATAQAKALNDLMTNYQNQYKNRVQQAYRGAARRAKSNSGGNGGGGDDTPDNNNGLELNINGGGGEVGPTTVNTTNWSSSLGKLNSTADGKLYYLDATPTKNKQPIYISNLTSGDDATGAVGKLGSGYNGQRKIVNGVQYIYIDTGQFAPSWYRVDSIGGGE